LFPALVALFFLATPLAAHAPHQPGAVTTRGAPAVPSRGVTPVVTALPGPGSGQIDRTILEDPARPETERERDAGSHPLEVYEFLGIRPGMAVADIMPFAGYNAHLLARVVAPGGRVVAPYAFSEEGVTNLKERFERAGIDNAEPLLNLDAVPDESLDLVLTVRNVHDWYIPAIEERFGFDREEIVASIMRTLKPGGILGVVDARTPEEGVNDQTHRINAEFVIAELEAAGFELVERSDMLAVPDDDYSEMGFPTRWNEDRMLLKFRKPAGGR
jgi:predicted methyltransferase